MGETAPPWRFPVFAHIKQTHGRKHLRSGTRVLFSMRHRKGAASLRGTKKWEAFGTRVAGPGASK